MLAKKDYLLEIQKFTTSNYWNSGVRITTGVLIPMVLMAYSNTLSIGIPFLLGALFVGITDTPGPIHHRRNGMMAAILLNVAMVSITGILQQHSLMMMITVAVFTFLLTFIGIYGARAATVGTLALIMMLINMSPQHPVALPVNISLTLAGGIWYAIFSLLLNRIQPYRSAEQALGEFVSTIAGYLRARASLYKEGVDTNASFKRIVDDQIAVVNAQNQVKELLYKTRQMLGDASPRSRSIMMTYLEAVSLFEETTYIYQEHAILHRDVGHLGILAKFYRLILQVAAEVDYYSLKIQSGDVIKTNTQLYVKTDQLEEEVRRHLESNASPVVTQSLAALINTVENIRMICNRLANIAAFSRQEIVSGGFRPGDHGLSKTNFSWEILVDNLTLRSNHFKFSIRITAAILIGFFVSSLFDLSHAYWVLLTIVTILKPAYNLARRRNYSRVGGTLLGVLLAGGMLLLTKDPAFLFAVLIISMLLAYSFLRVFYFGFVTFLTLYIIITFHFLNPAEFSSLMTERLIDTIIGAGIAALSARYLFPHWQHQSLPQLMKEMLRANMNYLKITLEHAQKPGSKSSLSGRSDAIIGLTNIADSFQQMLGEPMNTAVATRVHQFVIANHMLTSRISSLTSEDVIRATQSYPDTVAVINSNFTETLDTFSTTSASWITKSNKGHLAAENPLFLVQSLASEIRNITRAILLTTTDK